MKTNNKMIYYKDKDGIIYRAKNYRYQWYSILFKEWCAIRNHNWFTNIDIKRISKSDAFLEIFTNENT